MSVVMPPLFAGEGIRSYIERCRSEMKVSLGEGVFVVDRAWIAALWERARRDVASQPPQVVLGEGAIHVDVHLPPDNGMEFDRDPQTGLLRGTKPRKAPA